MCIRDRRAVFPKETALLPVGGITPDNMDVYVKAGANGFGLGSAIYKPGMTPGDVSRSAHAFAAGWKALTGQ